jgi:mRNA-degrading endonuclease toxin of MazEF toxin-antitoxin module
VADFPNKFPRRGEIYWAPAATKVRPVVVVSADSGNQHTNSVVVAVITTQLASRRFAVNVRLSADNPLPKEGEVLCRSLYVLPKDELKGYRATLSPSKMEEVDAALRKALAL